MKNLRIACVLGSVLVMGTAFSAQSTATAKSFWSKLEESPLKMSFLEAIETDRKKDGDLQGAHAYHYLSASYSLTDKDTVALRNEASNSYGGQFSNDATRVSYKRSGILTQQANGVDMSFFQSYSYKWDREKTVGYTTSALSVAKDYADFSWSNSLTYYWYDNSPAITGEEEEKRTKDRIRLTTSVDTNVTDNLSVGSALRYQLTNKMAGAKDLGATSVTLFPSTSYSFPGGMHAIALVGIVPVANDSTGDMAIVEDMEDKVGLELSYQLSLF